jgi:phage-related protein
MPEAEDEKPIEFLYDSLEVLKAFPVGARRDTGYELGLLQLGLHPTDAKPMKAVGAGVYEIRVSEAGQAFRTLYVAKFEEAIYVLHAFEKKSQKTPKKDLELGKARYRELVRERSH